MTIPRGDLNQEAPDTTPHTGLDARRLFDAQRAAWNAAGPPSREARLEALHRLASIVTGHADAFAAAISTDFGNRPTQETQLLEVVPTLNAIRHASRNLPRWMRPERRHVAWTFKPGKAWVQFQPLGVVGIISPWNYPLLLSLSPLVDALAAGNRVLLKPSELTPRFSDLLKRRLGEAFSEEQVAVVVGGPDVADAFSHLPFDHLLFTGSTAVGRKVMAAAAENLTPVTLELGGKSPVVVCPDYDVHRAALAIVLGKFSNAGQTCIAPDYALAPRAAAAALAEAIIDQARRAYPAIGANPDYASIINDRHFQRLERAIQEAERAGARVIRHTDGDAAACRKIGPTVVIDPPVDSTVMRDEIFGPVLPIVPYDSLEQAIAYVNAHDRPLALYCFSRDARIRDRVLRLTISGDVTLNGTLIHIAQDDLPFGGVGTSGIGAYHGRDGFRRLSHARGVYQVRGLNVLGLFAPPYGKRANRLIRFLMKS